MSAPFDWPPAARSSDVSIMSTVLAWSTRPPVGFSSAVRMLLLASYEGLLEADDVHRIAMAGYEMVDNLIKYSLNGEGHFDAEIVRRDGATHARLYSINPAAAEHRQAARLLVARLQDAPSPIAVYEQLLASSPTRLGSGLGLARIQAEGEMSLDCVADDARVTLVAGRMVATRRLP
jgi:hypothetical protein